MKIKSWLLGLAAACAAFAVPAAASASAQLPHQSAEDKVTSPIWSGYVALADKGTKFRYVAADLTVEWPHCPYFGGPDSATFYQSAGLNGYNHGAAEQIGVDESCADFQAGAYTEFDAWYGSATGKHTDFLSCLPAYQPCPTGPNARDRVQLSVYYNGKIYRLSYDDVTSKVRHTFYVRCSKCRNNSAEVVNQTIYQASGPPAPAVSIDFFGIRVTGVSGKHGAIAALPRSWTSTEITEVDSAGNDLAVPSALLRHGRAFQLDISAPRGCDC